MTTCTSVAYSRVALDHVTTEVLHKYAQNNPRSAPPFPGARPPPARAHCIMVRFTSFDTAFSSLLFASAVLCARLSCGVMPNPRQVASEGKRSPSSKRVLHKGFRTCFCELGNGESLANPRCGKGVKENTPLSMSPVVCMLGVTDCTCNLGINIPFDLTAAPR